MNSKSIFRYTLADIAMVTGRKIETVRDHKQAGKLDPEDLESVARYIVAAILVKAPK